MIKKAFIKTHLSNLVDINSNNQIVIDHFNAPSSCVDFHFNQINDQRFYDRFFPKTTPSTIIDLGANAGLFTIYAQDGGNVVYAVEPTPNHFEVMTDLTKNYPNVKRFNQAISPENGEVSFYISDSNTTMNSIANKYGKAIKVDGIRLDTFLEVNNIESVDLIKIDIEGSEMMALTEEIINNIKDKIKFYFIEVHATNGKDIEANRRELKKRFSNCGIDLLEFIHDCLISG